MNSDKWDWYLAEQATKQYGFVEGEFKVTSKDLSTKLVSMLINDLMKHQPEGKLLDVGCALGNMVKHLNTLGYEAEGLTISEEHVKRGTAQGLTIHLGDAHDMPLPDKSYDIVMCTHVIEHALSPIIMIRELNRVLKVGGVLALSTPTSDSVYAWLPLHYTCFTAKQLYHLLIQNGFELLIIRKPLLSSPELQRRLDEWQILARKTGDWCSKLNHVEGDFKIFNLEFEAIPFK